MAVVHGMNNSHPSNQSNIDPLKFVTSEHLPFVVLAILIVLVNTSVVLLFAFKRNLRRPCNYLFVSLSVSDLLTGLIGLPLLLVCSTTPNCLSCIITLPFIRFTSISTVLHILVITYERYAKIVFPFRMQQIGHMLFELKVIATLWSISLVVSLVPFSWVQVSDKACFGDEIDSIATKSKVFGIILLSVFVVLPSLLLLYADVSVTFIVVRQLKKIDKTSVGSRDSKERIRKECKVIAISAVMMVYFLVCWSFYYTGMILDSLDKYLILPEWLHFTVDILRCSTPLFNPILYVLLKQDFRNAVKLNRKQLARNRGATSMRYSNDTATVCKTSNTCTRDIVERRLLPVSDVNSDSHL